jgi:hypothetical protein
MHSVSFVIYTTDRYRDQIRHSAPFRQLSLIVPVTFERIADEEIRDAIATQQRVWSKAIDQVGRRGGHLFFLPPDVIWSTASMRHIGRAMANGRRMVIIPWSVRVVSDTFQDAITASFERRDDNLGIGSRDLVRMTLQHLHPLMAAYKRDSTAFPHHAEMLIETVRNQGLLLRLLASIPTVFEPASVPLSDNKLAIPTLDEDEVYIPEDSDDVFVASLTPLGKDSHFFARPRCAEPLFVGRWWLGYRSGSNDLLVRSNYRIHHTDLEPSAWRDAERRFDHFLRRCVIAREGLEVWQAVRSRGDCITAAEAIAGALQTGSLARAIRGHGERLIFLPNDSVLRNHLPDALSLQGSRKAHAAFVQLLRSHIACLTSTARSIVLGQVGGCSVTTENGEAIQLVRQKGDRLLVDGHRIIEAPLAVGDHVILIVPFVRKPYHDGKGRANLPLDVVAGDSCAPS